MKDKYILAQKIAFISFTILGFFQIVTLILISNNINATLIRDLSLIPFATAGTIYGLISLRLYFYRQNSKTVNIVILILTLLTGITLTALTLIY